MRIKSDPAVIYARIFAASRESAEETLTLVQKKLRALPLARGTLASSYELEVLSVSPDGVDMEIASDSPYAAVIERGGWVGGRGPHVSGGGKGRHILRDTIKRDWGRRMGKALRAAA